MHILYMPWLLPFTLIKLWWNCRCIIQSQIFLSSSWFPLFGTSSNLQIYHAHLPPLPSLVSGKNDWISWLDLLQKAVSHKSKLFDDHIQLKNEGYKTSIRHIYTSSYAFIERLLLRWQQNHSNPVQINWCLLFIFSIQGRELRRRGLCTQYLYHLA